MLVEWIYGREPAPLPELASWPSPLPTPPPCLDNVATLPIWDNSTDQTNPSSLSNRQLVPLTTTDAPGASQIAPTTEPISPHSSHTSSLETSDSITDFAITLLKPRPTQGLTVILSRIETHVYLDIHLPSRSWNAIQLPLTKSVTSDDSSSTREGIIAVSEFVCHSPNTTTRHHRLGDDSRLRLALAAQKKHTTCKCNISAREPGGTDVILAHFLFFHP